MTPKTHPRILTAATLFTFFALQACSGSDLFGDPNDGPATSVGAGGNASTSTSSTGGSGTSTSNTGGNGTTASSSNTGGSANVGGMGAGGMGAGGMGSGGMGGMGSTCAHPVCDEGVALDPTCDPCVQQICANDPFCCGAMNGNWDVTCRSAVFSTCGVNCDPLCAAQYAGAPGYYPCEQSATECRFGFSASQFSCEQFCQSAGGECINQFNNQGTCGLGQELGCQNSGFMSTICICSLGCGNGPACTAPQSCVNGSCQ